MFRGEGGNGLTLRNFLVFLFELPFFSTLLRGGMGLVSPFFFIASAPVFCFKEDDPYSMMIELLEGSTA